VRHEYEREMYARVEIDGEGNDAYYVPFQQAATKLLEEQPTLEERLLKQATRHPVSLFQWYQS
jgi:hypothetical protein